MATFTITSTADTAGDTGVGMQTGADGNYTGTLREAINFANLNVAAPGTVTTIVVAANLAGGTVTLAGNLPLVATSIQFDGGAGSTTGQALTINGGNQFRGLLISGIAANGLDAAATTVGISNVDFISTVAQGGMGAGMGGGGLGAGGAIFVGPAANVTLTDVDISRARAKGGSSQGNATFGAGGGLGGAGGSGRGGGGGGLFYAGAAGNRSGGGGITGAAVGGAGGAGLSGLGGGGNGQANGMFGGGGGGGYTQGQSRSMAGSGGFGGGGGASLAFGGNGGFGGGGGAMNNGNNIGFDGNTPSKYSNGGFGGGGGGASGTGGDGGFAAGGGTQAFGARGGFGGSGGGGNGQYGGAGGAGASLGGAIFVTAGGSLTISGSSTESGSYVTAVAGVNNGGGGAAHGGGIFFQGKNGATTALAFGAGTQTYSDEITDYIGSGGTNPNGGTRASDTGGSVTVVKSGTGSLTLSGLNTYSGGTMVSAGTLVASHADGSSNDNIDALGNGAVALNGGTLANGTSSAATLVNAVTVGAGGGTIDNEGQSFTLAGPITGAGDLTFAGPSITFVVGDTHGGATILGNGVGLFGQQSNAFSAASTYEVGARANLSLGGNETILALADGPGGGGSVNSGFGSGTLTLVGSSATSFSGTLVDGGFFTSAPLTLVKKGTGTQTLSGANTYSGGTTIAGGTLDLGAANSAGTGAITFMAMGGTATATLALESAAQPMKGTLLMPGATFGNVLTNFNTMGESLDLKNFAFTGLAAYASSGTSLTIVGGTGGSQTQTFRLSGGATLYTAQADAAGTGTLITAVCYCAGTAIRVWRDGAEADVAVETLAIGDVVVTASGAHRPIRWLGQRSYSGRFANRNPDVLPICFKSGSLADNVPARDLWVSPKHAMVLDGMLVPAECLVNGLSVIKASRVDRIDYHHVELDSHDMLLAEGAPSESFVDDDSRNIFHNAHEHAMLFPEAVRVNAVYCAPRLESGFDLETIRRRLSARACREPAGDADRRHVA